LLGYEVTRTIVAEHVVVTQWTFTGTNSGPLPPLPVEQEAVPFGKTIRLRGASIYDIDAGLIQRETVYIDMATLVVELGVEL
jgi:predicted ester cyclase